MTTSTQAVLTEVKPRLGFLGVGWIGQNRLKAIHQNGSSEVRAICDFAPEVANEAAKDIDTCGIFSSYEELLEKDLDGVVIATPSALHADQTRQALLKNKAVFVQKPLALDAHTTRELVRLAEERNCLLKVDFSYRHTKAMKAVKEVLDSGEIGEVFAADLVFHNAYGPDKDWYYNVNEAGGGCLTDLGIHLIDLLFWLNPDVETETLHNRLYKNGKFMNPTKREIEDYATASIGLNNGLTAQLACSWNLNAGREAIIEASFYGTKGGVKFRNINGSFYNFEAVLFKGTQTEVIENSQDDWGGRAGVAWADQLARGNRFDTSNIEYIKVAETLDKIYGRG